MNNVLLTLNSGLHLYSVSRSDGVQRPTEVWATVSQGGPCGCGSGQYRTRLSHTRRPCIRCSGNET